MARGIISHVAGWLALAFLLAFFVPFLWNGIRDGDGGALFGAFLVAPWIASPVICAAAFAGASPTRFGAALFLLFELALIASTALLLADLKLNGNSTSAIALLFFPLSQWVAILIVFLIALACGWRMRPDFLKD